MGLGVAYRALNGIKYVFKNNYVVSNVLGFLYAIFCGGVVLWFVINFNFGEFRLFIVLSFVFGAILAYKTIGKIIAKIFMCLYNKLCKVVKTLTKTKLVKKVLK